MGKVHAAQCKIKAHKVHRKNQMVNKHRKIHCLTVSYELKQYDNIIFSHHIAKPLAS